MGNLDKGNHSTETQVDKTQYNQEKKCINSETISKATALGIAVALSCAAPNVEAKEPVPQVQIIKSKASGKEYKVQKIGTDLYNVDGKQFDLTKTKGKNCKSAEDRSACMEAYNIADLARNKEDLARNKEDLARNKEDLARNREKLDNAVKDLKDSINNL